MPKFIKKPVVIEAVQWFKQGDHPGVEQCVKNNSINCQHCGLAIDFHGWIDTLEGGHIVCPGDFIITGVQGENYPCKPGIFEQTYEEVEDVD